MHDVAIPEALLADAQTDDESALTMGAMVVRFRPATKMGRKQLERFCAQNSELRVEQTAKGDLIIMPLTFSDSGWQNAKLTTFFMNWAEQHGGKVGDSNKGGMRAPDVSWLSQARYEELPKRERERFARICPDFVLELRSETDRLRTLHKKMLEYIANGARLGWLIDPLEKQVFVYRPGVQLEHLLNPVILSDDPVLAGFTLNLTRVW